METTFVTSWPFIFAIKKLLWNVLKGISFSPGGLANLRNFVLLAEFSYSGPQACAGSAWKEGDCHLGAAAAACLLFPVLALTAPLIFLSHFLPHANICRIITNGGPLL